MNDFVIHSCEQVLRFSRANMWSDLSEERKVQLGFNMGVMSLGLNLTKEEGFQSLSNARQGNLSMQDFQKHLRTIVANHKVKVSEANIAKPF